jgi:hypothetical protein
VTYSFYMIVEGKGLRWFFEPQHITDMVTEVESLRDMVKIKYEDYNHWLKEGNEERTFLALTGMATYHAQLVAMELLLEQAVEEWHETLER